MAVVDPQSKYRTFRQRFWAGALDGLVLMPVGMISGVVFVQESVWLTMVWLPVQYLAYTLYSVVSHGMYGKTVGKHLMNIVVLDNTTEGRITWRQAIIRDIFLIVSNLASVILDEYVLATGTRQLSPFLFWLNIVLGYASLLWFLTEIVTCLTNPKRRALHDFIAGTVVVSTKN